MKNINNNSKNIRKHDIFIATHDILDDRSIFIDDAIKNKASLIITDENVKGKGVPILKVPDANDAFFQIANDFYGDPLKNIQLIGITGTDGKTTTASIIYELLKDKKCAYLGTNGFTYKEHIETKNTTPGILEIFKYAKILKDNNCNYLCMEASSEGLLHNRVKNLTFSRAVLTNITMDHLNIHGTFDNYLASKLKLFSYLKKDGIAILNIDDKNYEYFKKNIKNKVISYGSKKGADFYFYNIKIFVDKTLFNLKVFNKTYIVTSPLVGEFNVYNLVAALAVVTSFDVNITEAIDGINNIVEIQGRMNFIDYGQNYKIILDYAHTKKATSEVLTFLNKVKKRRIITVVGCAGGRYKEKRAEIGNIVSNLSDIAIFTEDDSRYEVVDDIINDMLKGVKKNNVKVVSKRKRAIKLALDLAKKDDIVVVLGKGLDNYLAIKNKYKKYNDKKVIKRYFTKIF